MRFFIALTVFLIIISISKIIISISEIAGNQRNSTNKTVNVWAYPKCKTCGGHEVTIVLYEKNEYSLIRREDCNKEFYIVTNTSSLTPKGVFTANFSYTCNETHKHIYNKKPMLEEELLGEFYIDFGFINFNDLKLEGKSLEKKKF